MNRTTARCLAATAFAVATAAHAGPPANLAGTTWTVQANRNAEQLVITTQGGAGAPGAANCQVINGTIGIAPVRGWYCPSTGRIHFLHKNIGSANTVRVFTGNVSDDMVGQPLYIGGTLAVDDAAFGNLGETNFSAVR